MKIDKIKKDKMVMLKLFFIFDIDLLLKFILYVRYFYLNKIFVGGIDIEWKWWMFGDFLNRNVNRIGSFGWWNSIVNLCK